MLDALQEFLRQSKSIFIVYQDYFLGAVYIAIICIGFSTFYNKKNKFSTTMAGIDIAAFGYSVLCLKFSFNFTFGQSGFVALWLVLLRQAMTLSTIKDSFIPRGRNLREELFSEKEWQEIEASISRNKGK